MTRKFSDALNIYRKIFDRSGSQIGIQAKLIICLTVNGELEEAIELLLNLLDKNSDFYIKKNFEKEICPCKYLIGKVNNNELETDGYKKNIMLGIFWMYRNIENALYYFNQAYKLKSNDNIYRLEKKLTELIKSTNQVWS